jgi:hypothetical protein
MPESTQSLEARRGRLLSELAQMGDFWQRLGPDIVPQLLASGYGFDFVDDDVITRWGAH